MVVQDIGFLRGVRMCGRLIPLSVPVLAKLLSSQEQESHTHLGDRTPEDAWETQDGRKEQTEAQTDTRENGALLPTLGSYDI